MFIRIMAALLLLTTTAEAKSLRVMAFGPKGQLLNTAEFLRHIAPQAHKDNGIPVALSGLHLMDMDGRPVPERPWWKPDADKPVWEWEGAERVMISLPWPIVKDGFSTVLLDGKGKGYFDGQAILLNEEIAVTAYRRMQEALKARKAGQPSYTPSKRVEKMISQAQKTLSKAHAAKEPRKKARICDQALTQTSYAWQQVLYEHGQQVIHDPKAGPQQRFGVSLDETLIDRIHDFETIADAIDRLGASWVRLVFSLNRRDFIYAKENSFAPYDKFVEMLAARKIRVMGSVLDSMLWPKDLTPQAYQDRTRNLAAHFQDKIRSWEIASEPNADWLGGTQRPLAREDILLCVQKAVVAVKKVDASLETVATLHWWEGTSRRIDNALFPWLDWAVARGFGRGVDVLALSVYPHRHPLGIAFDPVFSELHRRFPDKPLMLGGFSYVDGAKLNGYWWLEATNIRDARKDLLVLYTGTAAAVPHGIGGGFYWPTLTQMLPPGRKPTSIYALYQRTLKRLRR
ncbi:MAG: hypothetical protein ABIJ96_10800 [Elusimicrobiota bacterium]